MAQLQHSSTHMRAKRLRSLRIMAGFSSMEAFGKAAEIGLTTLKYWESARGGGLSKKGANKVADYVALLGIQCSPEWLLHGMGQAPYYTDLQEAEKQQTDDHEHIQQEISLFRELSPGAVTLLIDDDGMEPFYSLGDIVGGVRLEPDSHEAATNHHCIVELKTGEVICRYVKQGTQENRYHLSCVNQETTNPFPVEYDVDVVALAPVIWWRKPLSNI